MVMWLENSVNILIENDPSYCCMLNGVAKDHSWIRGVRGHIIPV